MDRSGTRMDPQKTEAGVYNRRGGKGLILPLGRYSTILQADIIGILVAAHSVVREGSHEKVFICTDSKAELTVLQSMRAESKFTLECHNPPNSLAKVRAVELPWIPGHSRFSGIMVKRAIPRNNNNKISSSNLILLCFMFFQTKLYLNETNFESVFVILIQKMGTVF